MSLGCANPIPPDENPPLIVTVPGIIESAIPVLADETCPRDAYYFRDGIFHASPYPRPIPGLPADRNFHGASFAVANMTGFAAAALINVPREHVATWLIDHARR